MDPDAALALLIDAAVAGMPAEVREVAADLAEWLECGGFAPRDPRHPTNPTQPRK